MRKIRVLFPYVEAGFGHIMPMRAIEESFRKKYGDRVEIVPSVFFAETGDKHLKKFEQMMAKQVRLYNKLPLVGHIATAACGLSGTALSSFATMRCTAPVACKKGIEHMASLSPDVVFSTHWATNYYAEKVGNKPLTVMYCPDARLNRLFEYHCDMCLISMPYGYMKALRKKQYNIRNIQLVPFLIRNEAFGIDSDKMRLRKKLGIPEKNFTVLLAEGGYGIGKIAKVTEILIKKDLPITVIPVCGTNEKLFRRLKALKSNGRVTLVPYAFADNMLELQAASDVFCGKSGNMLAEATFFGNPSVVTHFANSIERYIADHYINTVGCAIKEFSPQKAADLICGFAVGKDNYDLYRRAALDYHDNFGAEKTADLLWKLICGRFPDETGTAGTN